MKSTTILILLLLTQFYVNGQEKFTIFLKQNTKKVELKDSIKIRKAPFELIFQIDIKNHPPKNNYWYSVFYVSSIEKNAYLKYKKIKSFEELPQYKPGNCEAISLLNYDSTIAVTESVEIGDSYGELYVSKERMMSFNNAEFKGNMLVCYFFVNNLCFESGKKIPIEKSKYKEICFFFSSDKEKKIIKIQFQ